MTTPGACKAMARGRPQRRLITGGALAGSPHTVTIWQGIREFFRDGPVELDFILYSNYARANAALLAGEVDAAVVSTKTWEGLRRPGQPGGDLEVVFETPGYSHCIMTALDTLDDDLATAFVQRLMEMDWNDPEQRTVMELEWMHRWVPAEGADYTVLMAEVERLAARGALAEG